MQRYGLGLQGIRKDGEWELNAMTFGCLCGDRTNF